MTAELYFRNESQENVEKVIEAGRRLILHFIQLYGRGRSREDLYQVGVLGLLKALKRYDPSFGSTFATYAGSFVIGEIRHYVRKETAYYMPRTVEKLQNRMDCLVEDQFSRTGEIPDPESIAKKLNIREEGIYEVMRSGLVPLDEIDLSKVASSRHETFKLPIEERIMLEQAIKKLTDTQRKVIDMLFYKDMTQVQAAENLDMNQRKVSRVLHTGLEKLKKLLA
ncbi:MAG: sigma-70 family RNA polymerase sigma factor [Ruminiclostridium sp.]|nr:sigma-70 family RNA polymerase sigma factor [Ruminiclostridium sp.]